MKAFKVRKRVALFTVTYVSSAFMALIAFWMFPADHIAFVVMLLCAFITFIIVFSYQHVTLQISDSELIMNILFFKNVIRFEDVEECYVVNDRVLSFYLRNGRQSQYNIFIYEDPEGILTKLDKHIKVQQL